MRLSHLLNFVRVVISLNQAVEKLGNLENKVLAPTSEGLNIGSAVFSMREGVSDAILEAIHYIPYAGATVCALEKLNAWDCSFCKKLGNVTLHAAMHDPRHDTFAIVITDLKRKEIVLSFRGTHSLKNWGQSFKTFQTDFLHVKQAKVHTGFKECSDGLSKKYIFQIKRLLQRPKFNQFKVVVTGHSIGGAIAVLSSLRLKKALSLPWYRLRVFTYGQPRIGNTHFANYINSLPLSITRVVNENDLFSHLPPPSHTYVHHHAELHINNGFPKFCSKNTYEDPTCSLARTDDISIHAHHVYFQTSIRKENC